MIIFDIQKKKNNYSVFEVKDYNLESDIVVEAVVVVSEQYNFRFLFFIIIIVVLSLSLKYNYKKC